MQSLKMWGELREGSRLKASKRINSKRALLVVFVSLIFCFSSSSHAESWFERITTNTTSWSISRESMTMTMDQSESTKGMISPIEVTTRGRHSNGTFSRYSNIKINEVARKERTSATEGNLAYGDQSSLFSDAMGDVNLTASKMIGSPIFHFEATEQWPVAYRSQNMINYKGSNINDRDFAENTMDFTRTNLLYNKELLKQTNMRLILAKLNATIDATNDGILMAELRPTKLLDYSARIQSTGIADLSYQQTSNLYDPKRSIYPQLGEGDERYYGNYEINRRIMMRTISHNSSYDSDEYARDDWLPCCYSGYLSMPIDYRRGPTGFGSDVKGIFDCTCFKVI